MRHRPWALVQGRRLENAFRSAFFGVVEMRQISGRGQNSVERNLTGS